MEIKDPQTRMVVHKRIVKKGGETADYQVYEGDPNMSQEQSDSLATQLGDGNARVTASRELSIGDYGNGVKVMVSVSANCHQATPNVNYTLDILKEITATNCEKFLEEGKAQAVALGLLKP